MSTLAHRIAALIVGLALGACSGERSTAAATQQATPVSAAVTIDEASGLVVAENWELVRSNCTACHSGRLITQQRAGRQTWLEIIRWMQATQNLWLFDADTETKILDYLSTYYQPTEAWRRMPLQANLRPPNPYAETLAQPDN